MITEAILKWKSVVCEILYALADKQKTIRYSILLEKCKMEITYYELWQLLDIVGEEEYKKHKIFITVLAVRNHGVCRPSREGFEPVVKRKRLSTHKGLAYEEICKFEKDRVFEFARAKREAEYKKKWPPHNLF
jgi:hypothetical protein